MKKIFLSVLTVLAFSISVFEPIYNSVPKEQYRATSSNNPLSLGSIPRLCRFMIRDGYFVRFHFEIEPRSLRDFQNVFQTASYNDGVRVEIDASGQVSLVVSDPADPTKLYGVVALGLVKVQQRTAIEVEVRDGQYLGIRLDNSTRVRIIAEIAPKCDAVLVGGGFDETRRFDGRVELTLTYGEIEKTTYFGMPYVLRHIGQAALLILLFCWYRDMTLRSRQKCKV